MLPISPGPWPEAARPRQIVRACQLRLPAAVSHSQVREAALTWLGDRCGLAKAHLPFHQDSFELLAPSLRVVGEPHPADTRRWGLVVETVQRWLPSNNLDVLWRTELEVVREHSQTAIEVAHTYYSDALSNAYTPHWDLAITLAQTLGAADAGIQLLDAPRHCISERAVAGLVAHLLAPGRLMPIAVVAQDSATGAFPADPSRLAAALAGAAHVVALAAPAVPLLRAHLGRLLYVGHGTGRIYMPGLEIGCNPLDHPLIRLEQPSNPAAAQAASSDSSHQQRALFERRMRHAGQYASAVLHQQRMTWRSMRLPQPQIEAAYA